LAIDLRKCSRELKARKDHSSRSCPILRSSRSEKGGDSC
jgi:hypothetical protein